MSRCMQLPVLAVTVLAVAACTSSTTPEASTTSASSSVPSTGWGMPSASAPTSTVEQPVVRAKQINEPAGYGCVEEGSAECDVTFSITSIQQGVQCEDEYGEPVGPDEQMLRFDIDIQTAPQFRYPDIDSVFFLDNWGIGADVNSVRTELVDHISLDCQSDQISKFLDPGTHLQKSIVVSAPKPASVLRLFAGPNGDGFWWPIPPAAES